MRTLSRIVSNYSLHDTLSFSCHVSIVLNLEVGLEENKLTHHLLSTIFGL